MDMKLELIPVPVSDVDRSKTFYVDAVGFHLDHDVEPGNGMRIVQLTPPGSACSIAFGTGMTRPDAAPGHGIHLAVDDIAAVPAPPGARSRRRSRPRPGRGRLRVIQRPGRQHLGAAVARRVARSLTGLERASPGGSPADGDNDPGPPHSRHT